MGANLISIITGVVDIQLGGGVSWRCWRCGVLAFATDNDSYFIALCSLVGGTILSSPVGHQGYKSSLLGS